MKNTDVAMPEPYLASAALLVICTTIPSPDDRRATLIREIVNSGMDDDEAVEFLSLAVMPLSLIEEVNAFLTATEPEFLERRRQGFFRFANDVFHTNPLEKACLLIVNAIKVHPDNNRHFMAYMDTRIDNLIKYGINCAAEMDRGQVTKARSLLALMDTWRKLSFEVTSGKLNAESIEDGDLAELTIEYKERHPELMGFILSRSTLDVTLLRELMSTPAPAIVKGIL